MATLRAELDDTSDCCLHIGKAGVLAMAEPIPDTDPALRLASAR
jgi:hypothetical protein